MSKTKKAKAPVATTLSDLQEILLSGNPNVITVQEQSDVNEVIDIIKNFNVVYRSFGTSIYLNVINLVTTKKVHQALAVTNIPYVFYHVDNPLGSRVLAPHIDSELASDIEKILMA